MDTRTDRIIPITDFTAPELDVYARLSENQLYHLYEPDTGIFIAESPNVIERALNAGYEPLSFLAETKEIFGEAQKVLSRCEDTPVFTADFQVLTRLTGFSLTRGLLCAMRRKPLPGAGVGMCRSSQNCCFGKGDESHQCRGDFPFRRRPGNGCRAFDSRLQRSPVPESRPGQHGNGVPDPLDLSG